jgi:hypothetical protein
LNGELVLLTCPPFILPFHTYSEEKIFHLCNQTLARELRAVQERAFLTVPFSGSTLGVRVGALAYNLAEAMAALTRGTPLTSLEFSSVDLAATNGRQVVAKSGVKAYTTLPIWNGTDLHAFCPGAARPSLEIRDLPDDVAAATTITKGEEKSNNDKIKPWAMGPHRHSERWSRRFGRLLVHGRPA